VHISRKRKKANCFKTPRQLWGVYILLPYLPLLMLIGNKMKKIALILLVALAACNSNKPTAPYKIIKVETKDGLTWMDVSIPARLDKQQLLDIAAKIKSDSSHYDNLRLDYILPGYNYNNLGGVSVYASSHYRPAAKYTDADTIRDNSNNLLSFEFVGVAPNKAKKLLAIELPEMKDKTLLGRFIDDNLFTVTLIYNDKKDNQKYILELDTAGTVVSPVVPKVINHNGIDKMIVTQQGDYMTLKDSVLTMYSSESPETPYRTLREGM
jgi:hypothetical protein